MRRGGVIALPKWQSSDKLLLAWKRNNDGKRLCYTAEGAMSLITGDPNLLVFSPQLANEWYGVKGGDKVEILYFVANDTPLQVGGVDSAVLFKELYAQVPLPKPMGQRR